MPWKKIESDLKQSNSWIFEEMGELEGIYLETRDAKSKKGKPITFHEFSLDSGEIVSVLGGVVLDRAFSSQIKKGTKVKIIYLGDKEGKGGTYKNYEVNIWED